MKSILAGLRRSKFAILTILEALNIAFCKNFTLENVKNSQKIQNSALKVVRNAVLRGFEYDQDLSYAKSEWQKNPEISHIVYSQLLGYPGL